MTFSRPDRKVSMDFKEEGDVGAWSRFAARERHAGFLEHKVQKMSEAGIFLKKVEEFSSNFEAAGSILETGGGSLWAAHIVKALYPESRVVGTDISPDAIENSTMWEPVFGSNLDEVRACRSYETPFESESFDLIFCFEAAHHFWKHRSTLKEVHRLLKPGGRAFYLHEPGCPQHAYRPAYRRVNNKRDDGVMEDVLVYENLVSLGCEVGLQVESRFDPSLTNRGPKETLYYFALNKVPALRRLLPCTVDIVIHKP